MRVRLSVLPAAITMVTCVAVLPFIYRDMGAVVARSHEQLFIENSRTMARLLAQQFEVGEVFGKPKLMGNLLDTAILNGDGRYAELVGPGVSMRSELNAAGLVFPEREDLGFGLGGDALYFIKTPVFHGGQGYELRLGFDETPTLQVVAVARRALLWPLGLYLGLLTLAGLGLGYLTTHPLRRLQRLARQVADNPDSQSLRLDTPVEEVAELAIDLQRMREALVAASVHLRAQISAREAAEQGRALLERRLQHRERLETVGTLAGGIAHEINNALVPITLLTELSLRDAALPEQARGDLQTVLAAARQARTLVQKILTFSRSLDDARPVPVDLGEAVHDALKLFRPLTSRSIDILVEVMPGCPQVMADRALLVQLVMNLCTNAYQSLPHGEGSINVRVLAGPQQGAAVAGVVLEVSDTGEGMDEARMARVFEPFYTTRKVGEGTGLGLSVVHGIVQGFGARIEIESRLGLGSTFRVLFPPAPNAGSGALLPANEHVE
jgi:signal transduction histidine kinase